MNNIINEVTMGQRIKARRKALKITQEQLAEIMCIPKSTISAYENDKVDIKGSVIAEISEILHTTPNYLLGTETMDSNYIMNLLNSINDVHIRESFIIQLEAVAHKYS